MDRFRVARHQLLQALELLTDEQLFEPYSSFVPGGGDIRQDPVLYWIVGNTFGQFNEHLGYIRNISEAG